MMKLKDKPDTPIPKIRLFAFRQLKEILGVKVNHPGGGAIKCSDNMKQCALSCSRSPHNRNQLPPLNLEIDPPQDGKGLSAHGERFVQIGDGDHAGAPD